MGVEVHCIPGNHDSYWKNTNDLNSLKELFHDHIHLYEDPTTINFGSCSILFMPWINKDNSQKCMEALDQSNSSVLIGHLELNGYEVMRGVNHSGGMGDTDLKKFDLVLSGHFHCKQNTGNVWYLGTQYDLTFSDVTERKGFHILDTDTLALEFVENPNKMYYKMYYNDEVSDYTQFPYSDFKDKYLRVVVTKKKSDLLFSTFCENCVAAGVANLSIVEDVADPESKESVDISKGTLELINDAIDETDLGVNPEKLKNAIRELYIDSLSL
jgi:DNA repair exonuclease SbcCD nuclease subunit